MRPPCVERPEHNAREDTGEDVPIYNEQEPLRCRETAQHFEHSNQMHKQATDEVIRRQDAQEETAFAHTQNACETKPLIASALWGDFYARNPTSLSNGWLAERHHRETLAATRVKRLQHLRLSLFGSGALIGLCPGAHKVERKRRHGRRRHQPDHL